MDLDPTLGQEQRGKRCVFAVSPEAFNRSGLAWVCPVTPGGLAGRFKGFAEPLSGTGLDTQGVVQCSRLRSLGWRAWNAKYKESAPDYVTEQVLARLRAVLD